MGSVVVPHGLSCPSACGIFLDQGSDPVPGINHLTTREVLILFFFPHITKEFQVHLISVYKKIPHKMDIIMMVFQMARIGRCEGREESGDGGTKGGREEKRK